MNLKNIFKFSKDDTKSQIPKEPLNVIRTKDGNFKTENYYDVKDASNGSLRTFMGNLSTLQNNKDVISNSQYTYDYRILEQFLENAYQQSWLAKKIVELPNEMAMMNGLNLELKNKNNEKKFWKKWNELNMNHLIIDSQKWADVYGSCCVLLKNKNQDPEKPYTNFKDLEFIQVQYPFYNPLPSPNDIYETDRVSFNLLGITADLKNIAVFYGTKCVKRLSPQFKYFGMSVFQNIWKAMISDDLITTAVANLIYRSSTPVYKLKGFSELVRAGKQDLVLSAIETAELSRGIFGALVQDTEDDFKMVGQSLTQLAEIDRRSAERVCAAVDFPATLILGKSPDGQNSTGKHDEKNLNLKIKRVQNKMLPAVKIIAESLLKHLDIYEEDWDISFNNPDYEDKGEEAKTKSSQLDNAIKLQQIINNPDVLNRYLKECEIINEEEYKELENLKADFDNENNSFEKESSQV